MEYMTDQLTWQEQYCNVCGKFRENEKEMSCDCCGCNWWIEGDF